MQSDPYKPPSSAVDAPPAWATDEWLEARPDDAEPSVTFVGKPFDQFLSLTQRQLSRWIRMIVVPVLATVIAVLVRERMPDAVRIFLPLYLLVMLLPSLLLLTNGVFLMLRQGRNPVTRMPVRFQLGRDAITWSSVLHRMSFRWRALSSIDDGRWMLVIVTVNGWRLAIPQRAFGDAGAHDAFVAVLRERSGIHIGMAPRTLGAI